MRCAVYLWRRSPPQEIPINYNYQLYSAILRKFKVARYDIHDSMKFFTFSRLMVPRRKVRGDRLEILSEEVRFYFSSPVDREFIAFLEGTLAEPEFVIAGQRFDVLHIESVAWEELRSGDTFTTLSPVTAYYRDSKTRRRVFPECGSERFNEVVRDRLVEKYRTIHGELPGAVEEGGCRDARLKLEVVRLKRKRIVVKGLSFTAYEMAFRVHGNEELIRLGYESGFGKMNTMGFGMVRKVDDSSSKRRDNTPVSC